MRTSQLDYSLRDLSPRLVELVEDNNLGIVKELDDMNGVDLYNLCEKAETNYAPDSMQFFLWKNIVERIARKFKE